MPSFQITVSPSRRVAARFVTAVRRAIQKALIEEQQRHGITQTAIAGAIGVHRSVISREIRGYKDLTLGRVAELAWALGREPSFGLLEPSHAHQSNIPAASSIRVTSSATAAATNRPYQPLTLANSSPSVATVVISTQ